MRPTGPGLPPHVLGAFLAIIVLGGSNAVAVRLGVAELPPLWAATLRFGLAAALLALLALARRSRLPRGRELAGATVYGMLNFALGYALMYLALVDVPAGFAMIVYAIVPLLTLLLAVLHRQEVLSVRGVLGAVIAVGGVTVAFGLGTEASIPLGALLLLLASAVVAAEAGVMVKVLPPGDPIGANLVGMTIGAVFLGGLSLATGETPVLPDQAATWVSVIYLAVVGSIGLFLTFLWLLARWTASGTSYAVLLMPMWTMVAAAIVLGEPLSPAAFAGGAVVILGTWLGAFGPAKRVSRPPAPEQAAAARNPGPEARSPRADVEATAEP